MITAERLGTAPEHEGTRRVGSPVVAVVATTPETVLDDVERAMRLGGGRAGVVHRC